MEGEAIFGNLSPEQIFIWGAGSCRGQKEFSKVASLSHCRCLLSVEWYSLDSTQLHTLFSFHARTQGFVLQSKPRLLCNLTSSFTLLALGGIKWNLCYAFYTTMLLQMLPLKVFGCGSSPANIPMHFCGTTLPLFIIPKTTQAHSGFSRTQTSHKIAPINSL